MLPLAAYFLRTARSTSPRKPRVEDVESLRRMGFCLGLPEHGAGTTPAAEAACRERLRERFGCPGPERPRPAARVSTGLPGMAFIEGQHMGFLHP